MIFSLIFNTYVLTFLKPNYAEIVSYLSGTLLNWRGGNSLKLIEKNHQIPKLFFNYNRNNNFVALLLSNSVCNLKLLMSDFVVIER
jgi:hypothetical protein